MIDQLFIDSIDVELKYAIGKLNSMLGITQHDARSSGLILEQNVPNPVVSSTVITYHLKENEVLSLSVCNIYGKLIQRLVNEYQKTGSYSVIWDSQERTPGLYLYRLTAGNKSLTKKCIVL